MNRHVSLAGVVFAFASVASAAAFRSPDGRLSVELSPDRAGQLSYTVSRDGKELMTPSKLGLIVNGRDVAFRGTLGPPNIATKRDAFSVPGVHDRADVAFTDVVVPVKTDGRAWTLEARVFNDGVAFRYRVPGESHVVTGENTEWRFPRGSKTWFQLHDGGKDYEGRYQTTERRSLPTGTLVAAPVLMQLPDGRGYAFVTEANLVNYTDAALTVINNDGYRAVYHNDVSGFEIKGELLTPWRVTVLSQDLNGLVNTDILPALCPPPAGDLADAKWIKPGRSVWHWRVTGPPKFEQQRKWVDWAAALGFEYYIVDDGWRDWTENGRDAWGMLSDVVEYAKTKNVAIIAWVHSKEIVDPAARLAYMKKSRSIGLAGLKIDFMRPANVEWVRWYDETLRDAAASQLVIDYHGSLKPTGRNRTWPNELTRESIGGREQGKLPGLHDTTLPFLRLVQGPADYTPTEFRADQLGGNTVAKELAQAVVYTSPLLCYSGVPQDYLDSPAVDVIKTIPATWDETVVLPGSVVGEVAAFARRKGDAWYVGVINGEKPTTLSIPLSFLKAGSWDAVELGDTPGKPATFARNTDIVDAGKTLAVTLSKDGGFVARLTPQSNP